MVAKSKCSKPLTSRPATQYYPEPLDVSRIQKYPPDALTLQQVIRKFSPRCPTAWSQHTTYLGVRLSTLRPTRPSLAPRSTPAVCPPLHTSHNIRLAICLNNSYVRRQNYFELRIFWNRADLWVRLNAATSQLFAVHIVTYYKALDRNDAAKYGTGMLPALLTNKINACPLTPFLRNNPGTSQHDIPSL
jgi:hypothetical protein